VRVPAAEGASREVAAASVGAPRVLALRRLLLNALSLLGAYLLPRLASFAAVVVAARVVGVSAFGAYGTAAALAVILSIAATLGMMQMLIRELARAPEAAPRLLGGANVVKGVSGLLMLAALLASALALGYSGDVVAASLLLGTAYAIGSWAENYGAWFQAAERMGVWMQAQAVYGLVAAGLGVTAVLATRSIVWFCAAQVAGQLAGLAWLMARTPAHLRLVWGAPWPLMRRLLVTLVPFTAAFVVLTSYYKVDILLVEGWRGNAEAGLYAAAYKFVDVAQALTIVLAAALYPRLSRAVAGSGGQASERAAATRALELTVVAAVPAAGMLWLLREPVVALLFGDAYAGAVPVLALLAAVLPVLAVNVLGTFILAAAGRMAAVAMLYSGALLMNVALNAAAIPALGAPGAALAMVVSECLLAGGMLVVLHRLVGAAPARRAGLAAVAAAGLAAAVSLPSAAPATAAAAYLLAVGLLYGAARVVPAGELRLLRQAVLP
jgi:PST family polysaccharide transporter